MIAPNKILISILFALFPSAVLGQNLFYDKLADSAVVLTKQKVFYDPAYTKIDYPNGDVAPDKGVCTDVVIRAYAADKCLKTVYSILRL